MDDPASSPVQLTIPANPRYLRLARLTAAGLAGDLGYSMAAIEDLRVAVDELCAALIDGRAGGELHLVYREVPGALVIEGRCAADDGAPLELHRVARELLDLLTDEYELSTVDGSHVFRLTVRAEATSG